MNLPGQIMRGCAAAAALAVSGVGFAGVASAAPTGGSSVADTVRELRAQGYTVRINGAASGPLSRCSVEQVRGLGTGTVLVDISCPDNFSTGD
ncbi:hypothetical protein [Mycolicibacterium baixiangningiae]|uniref:hypothetical protein n=1 Tax=Mycolicibacterium baixiangningiae TaxID=2761578 RepID=UPI0018D1E5D1|nr:hypothetical protein [Mycolicibacterium baixiangningiae]